jgi:hypothetical protein
VNVDETGSDDLILGVDCLCGLRRIDASYAHDSAILDADVSSEPWIATAINYATVCD